MTRAAAARNAAPPSRASEAPGRLVLFDGLRGLAAVLVLLFHFSNIAGETSLFSRGYLAVDFFFMLSGFVLVPVFEAGLPAAAPASLLIARVLRFWPLLVLGALIGALVHWRDSAIPGTPHLFLAQILLLPAGDPHHPLFPLNQAHWSLWCELMLNALQLWIMRKLRTRAVLVLASLCWLLAALFAFGHGSLDLGAGPTTMVAGIFRAVGAYGFGIVLRRSGALQAPAQGLPWWTAPLLLGVLILAPAAIGLPARITDPIAALAFAPVIALAAAARLPDHLNGAGRWLGALSFPLYAIHYPLLEIPQVWMAEPSLEARFAVLVLAVGLASLLTATPIASGVKLRARPASQLRPMA